MYLLDVEKFAIERTIKDTAHGIDLVKFTGDAGRVITTSKVGIHSEFQ